MVDEHGWNSYLSSKCSDPSELQIHVCGMPFTLDKELLAAKSEKLAALFEEKESCQRVSYFLQDIGADPHTFELVARFCHGYELQLSAENALPLVCIAYYLRMTETYSPNNLLKKAMSFLDQRVLPSWNETIRALRISEKILQQAAHLGLIDAFLESIVTKVQKDPRLLGKPIRIPKSDDSCGEDEDKGSRPNARRKLFAINWQSEDLTTLPLQFYEAVIKAMNQRDVPAEYVAASLCQFSKRWIYSSTTEEEIASVYKRKSQREAIEAVERLLPYEPGLFPCNLLFEMLKAAVALEASSDCRNGFEMMIGKQLDQATVSDLLIPFQGYAREVKYDIGCVKRILKSFYENGATSDMTGFIKVADLIEELLAELACDVDLEISTFVALAEMSLAASLVNHRTSDGIYRAIDIYLDKHRYLTDSEKEEVCRTLDCQKMSGEACKHAVQNKKLPLRVVVQVLFTEQLKLRDTITATEMQASEEQVKECDEDGGGKSSCTEDELRIELGMMSCKVMELERECCLMRKEIVNGSSSEKLLKKGKISMWGEIKRKFGCIGSRNDFVCEVKKKKVHPRHGR